MLCHFPCQKPCVLKASPSESKHQHISSMLRYWGAIYPSHFLVRRCFGPAAEIYLQVTLEHGDGGTMAHRKRVVIPRAEGLLNFIQFFKPFWERLTLNDLNMSVESDTGSLHASRFFIYWFDSWINRMHQMLLINHSSTQRVHIPFHSLLSRWCSFSLKIGCGICFHSIHIYIYIYIYIENIYWISFLGWYLQYPHQGFVGKCTKHVWECSHC